MQIDKLVNNADAVGPFFMVSFVIIISSSYFIYYQNRVAIVSLSTPLHVNNIINLIIIILRRAHS